MKDLVTNGKIMFDGIKKSEELKNAATTLKINAIKALFGDELAKAELLKVSFSVPAFLPNILFWENFNCFLQGLDYDPRIQIKLCERFDVEEDKEEYAIKIFKAIEKIDSKRKINILLNFTRALSFGMIDNRTYYRLTKILPDLAEQDIDYLKSMIKKGNFEEDEYTDDFIAYGLIRQTNEGFAYNRCAFEFVNYGIDFGHSVMIPEEIPQRISGGPEIVDF